MFHKSNFRFRVSSIPLFTAFFLSSARITGKLHYSLIVLKSFNDNRVKLLISPYFQLCLLMDCVCHQFYLVTHLQSKNNRRCLQAEPGDRLGLYFEHDMSSLSYEYIKHPSHLRALAHVFSNVSYPVADSSEFVQFNSIVYPYKFFAVAYYYRGKFCFFSSAFRNFATTTTTTTVYFPFPF